ncbi:MAG: hypothetical protein ACFFB3_18990 [Candidatus Hodarchaeota archaeon]
MDQVREYPDRKELLKEYEFCQISTQSMEKTIWQTSAIMGVGIIGTFLFIGTRSIENQPPWPVAAMIGGFSFLVSLMWWFIARRWWSVQHAMFMRMRHIEQDLGFHSTRYVKYLDDSSKIPKSELKKEYVQELQKRSEENGFFGKGHQRTGVQAILIFFPYIVLIAWSVYTLWLYIN